MISKFSTTVQPLSTHGSTGPVPLTDREISAVAGGLAWLIPIAMLVVAGYLHERNPTAPPQDAKTDTPDGGDGPTGGAGGSGDASGSD